MSKSRKGPRKKRTARFDRDTLIAKLAAHGLRREILKMISTDVARRLSPKECSTLLDEGISQTSYHCKVLRDGKAIKLVKMEPRRGAFEHYYGLTPLGHEVLTRFPAE